ncbi:unnamed protein product [Ceratitis capitata]|uniref:(Mediterranean fruit fly) hypothetical protein n=1 Tax=Ceratitis capitata TaxID=7213 RepID=A0A811U1S4_CERCA|nr:unnamed protein product [Ceratitis capitata]
MNAFMGNVITFIIIIIICDSNSNNGSGISYSGFSKTTSKSFAGNVGFICSDISVSSRRCAVLSLPQFDIWHLNI